MLKALCGAFLLMTALITTAQDSPRDVVLRAVADLKAGYHFTVETQTSMVFIEDHVEMFASYTEVTTEGDVAANGDHRTLFVSRGAETKDDIDDSPLIQFERVVVDGEIYLNVSDDDQLMGIQPGWTRFKTLLEEMEETAIRYGIEAVVNTPLPSELPLEPAVILDVVELDTEVIDDMEMRVFEVVLNPVALMIASVPGDSLVERLRSSLESLPASLLGDSEVYYQVWIGAEDEQLYKTVIDSYYFWPYRVLSGLGYDIEQSNHTEINISQHGEISEIAVPDVED